MKFPTSAAVLSYATEVTVSLPSLSSAATAAAPDVAAVVQSFRRITKSIHEFSKAVDREYGITGPQLWAMMTIQELESCSAGDLADRLFVHPSTITGVIQRLEEKRLINRQRRADDRRAVVLSLTPLGKKLLHRAPMRTPGHVVKALEVMPSDEVAQLRLLLDSLVEHMQIQDVETRFLYSDD